MEKIRSTSSRNENNFRLQTPILSKTRAPQARSAREILNTHKSLNDKTNYRFKKPKNSNTSTAVSEFCLSNVFSKEVGFQRSPDIQFEEPKSTSDRLQIQINQRSEGTRFPSKGRLGHKNRPETGLFSYTCGSISSAVSESTVQARTFEQSRTLTTNESALRSFVSSNDICDCLQLGSTTATKQRPESNRIPGRLPYSQSEQTDSDRSGCGSRSDSIVFGLEYQFRKIHFGSDSNNRVFRSPVESSSEHEATTSRKAAQSEYEATSYSENERMEFKRSSEFARNAKLRVIYHSKRSTSVPTNSNGLFSSPERPAIHKIRSWPIAFGGAKMVVDNAFGKHVHTPRACNTFHNYRCIRQRLGCRARRHSNERRPLAAQSESLAQQSQGDVGYYSIHSKVPGSSKRDVGVGSIRQQECSELHKERRWITFKGPFSDDGVTFSALRPERYSCDTKLHTGPIQRGGRLAISPERPCRVDLIDKSLSANFPSFWNTTDRSFCVQERSRRPTLRVTRLQGHESRIPRCLQQALVLSQSLDFPTTTLGAASSCAPQSGEGHFPPGSPSLAQSVLAPRPEEESNSSSLDVNPTEGEVVGCTDPNATSTGRSNVSRSMVSEGWDHLLINWSKEEKELLDSSWRPSTKRVYSSVWSKWQVWCLSKSIDHLNPTGSQLARYLAYLHLQQGLSYKTILVYKSTIATLTNPDATSLTDNPVVKRMLKAISIANARSSFKKPFVWDPRLVVEWLLGNKPTELTLYEVSRRTALILLLASSRRVHDLTLLHIDIDHYEDRKDHILLHPRFGSKTDSYLHRQSSWKFFEGHDKSICPVFWIKQLIEVSAQRRKNNNLSELFISACGKVRPASRTVLGGWVRSLLRAAGVAASAGSTRSAAASLNWLQQCSIDEVMAKGNWRSANTFARYYSAEIRSQQNDYNNLAHTFDTL